MFDNNMLLNVGQIKDFLEDIQNEFDCQDELTSAKHQKDLFNLTKKLFYFYQQWVAAQNMKAFGE